MYSKYPCRSSSELKKNTLSCSVCGIHIKIILNATQKNVWQPRIAIKAKFLRSALGYSIILLFTNTWSCATAPYRGWIRPIRCRAELLEPLLPILKATVELFCVCNGYKLKLPSRLCRSRYLYHKTACMNGVWTTVGETFFTLSIDSTSFTKKHVSE